MNIELPMWVVVTLCLGGVLFWGALFIAMIAWFITGARKSNEKKESK